MPSKESYKELIFVGIPVNRSRFNKFDTLKEKSEFEQLFDVLMSVKDKNRNFAVMAPITIIANPDFKKIKQSCLKEYFNEPFIETLKKNKRDADTFAIGKKE